MRRYALVGVLVAALSCARQTTAWDDTCWDCGTFRASLWLPFSKGDTRSRQWAVAAKMAADQFNARNGSIVAEFAELPPECSTLKLSVDVWDTAGGPTEAIKDFTKGYMSSFDGCVFASSRLTAVIVGPKFSSVAVPLSIVADANSINMISPSATSPVLDEAIHSNFMRTAGRTIPSDGDGFAVAFCDWFWEQGWTTVGIISRSDTLGRGVVNSITVECSTLESRPRFYDEGSDDMEEELAEALDSLRAEDTRIFFFISTTDETFDIMANLAVAKNVTGPDFAWLTRNRLETRIKTIRDPAIRDKFAPGFAQISVTGLPAGSRSDEFRRQFAAQNPKDYKHFDRCSCTNESPGIGPGIGIGFEPEIEPTPDFDRAMCAPTSDEIQGELEGSFAGFTFDAIATIGLAACSAEGFLSIEEMRSTAFEGVSGSVRFDPTTGSRPGNSVTYVVENARRPVNGTIPVDLVGEWRSSTGWVLSEPFVFSDGTTTPPSDGVVLECLPGYYLESNSCRPCPAGTFQKNDPNRGGKNSCINCNATAWSHEAADECTACPEHSLIFPKAPVHDSKELCICKGDFYATRTQPIKCIECPNKATCDGGLTGPYPDSGHWLDPQDPPVDRLFSYQCRYNFICSGGDAPATCHRVEWLNASVECINAAGDPLSLKNTNDWCKNGWDVERPFCSGERQGRYWYLDTQAIRCPARSKEVFSVAMMIVVLALFFAINEIRPHYPVLDAVLMSYQDLGIITLYFFDWSETISQFFFVFRVALFDVDVVEPTCAFEWGFNEAYRMMLSLPFAFAILQAAAYALRFKSGDEAYAGTLSFFVEAQASLLYYCISTFICRKIKPGDRNVYVEDPDTSCATGSSTTMQIIAVFYLLLIFVVTLSLFQRLWTAAAADELRSPRILARYGFLYRRLRMGAGFWWAVRMTKQAALVAILAWWSDPEDQAIFALLVLTTFAVFHALVRPETDRQVNRTEIYGVGISIFVVCLGLAFTAHARSSTGSASRKTDLRFVGYFGFAQILFLLYACYATATNIAAIRARAEVVDRVSKLHGAVLRARRRSSDLHLSDGFSSTSLRDPSPQLPGFRTKLARGIDMLRGGKSLTHTQALDLRGYENAVADSGGQLEVLNTFRGPPLKAYVRDTGTEGSDALALTRFVSLNRHLSPTVADTSPVGNFSRQHEASLYHNIGHAVPGLLDYALNIDRKRRASLADVISDFVAFDDNRSTAGAQCISDVLVEPIDVPSLLHYSVNASEREVNTLRGVVDGLVAATPRLHAQAEAVRARSRIAVRVQRAWRRRRRVYEAA